MRIRITGGGQDLNLVLPTNLIFSRATAWICQRIGMKYVRGRAKENVCAMFSIPDQALDGVFAELRRIKKQYGKWELVDVESSDGERVQITL